MNTNTPEGEFPSEKKELEIKKLRTKKVRLWRKVSDLNMFLEAVKAAVGLQVKE